MAGALEPGNGYSRLQTNQLLRQIQTVKKSRPSHFDADFSGCVQQGVAELLPATQSGEQCV